ncbi:MAG: hypothetical protein ACMG5Z_04505, partial [Luteimonas sp.]
VEEFVMSFAESRELLSRLEGLLKFLLPLYEREGKAYLTVAVGCTGGRHRSVMIVEALRSFLTGLGLSPIVRHRDLDRAGTRAGGVDGDRTRGARRERGSGDDGDGEQLDLHGGYVLWLGTRTRVTGSRSNVSDLLQRIASRVHSRAGLAAHAQSIASCGVVVVV